MESAGRLAVAPGWRTRVAALALAPFWPRAGLIFHTEPGNRMQMTKLINNLAVAGGLPMLVAN